MGCSDNLLALQELAPCNQPTSLILSLSKDAFGLCKSDFPKIISTNLSNSSRSELFCSYPSGGEQLSEPFEVWGRMGASDGGLRTRYPATFCPRVPLPLLGTACAGRAL